MASTKWYPKTIEEAIQFSEERVKLRGIQQFTGVPKSIENTIVLRLKLPLEERLQDLGKQFWSQPCSQILVIEDLTIEHLMKDEFLRQLRYIPRGYINEPPESWKPKEVWISSLGETSA